MPDLYLTTYCTTLESDAVLNTLICSKWSSCLSHTCSCHNLLQPYQPKNLGAIFDSCLSHTHSTCVSTSAAPLPDLITQSPNWPSKPPSWAPSIGYSQINCQSHPEGRLTCISYILCQNPFHGFCSVKAEGNCLTQSHHPVISYYSPPCSLCSSHTGLLAGPLTHQASADTSHCMEDHFPQAGIWVAHFKYLR